MSEPIKAQLADGRILEFPSGTDPAVIQATVKKVIASTQQPQAKSPAAMDDTQGTWRNAIEEPLVAMGGAVLGKIGSGLAGAVAAPIVGVDKAVGMMDEMQNTFSNATAPRTQMGMEATEAISGGIDKLVKGARQIPAQTSAVGTMLMGGGVDEALSNRDYWLEKGLSQGMGDAAMQQTGSPVMATLAYTAPEIAASVIPGKQIWNKNITQPRKSKAMRIYGGDQANELAPFGATVDRKAGRIEGKTPEEIKKLGYDPMQGDTMRLTSDETIKPLVRAGWKPGELQAAKSVSPRHQDEMLKMIEIKKNALENTSYGRRNRPSQVIGDSLLDRINHIRRVNAKAGKDVDIASKSLRGKQVAPEDMQNVGNSFLDSLEGMGVKTRNPDGTIRMSDGAVNFDYSESVFNRLGKQQKSINEMVETLTNQGKPIDAWNMHVMKGWIDEVMVDKWGTLPEGSRGKVERLAKNLRSNINQSLRNTSKEYAQANQIYSETIDILKEAQRIAGTKTDLTSPLSNEALGRVSRKVLSNYGSREQIIDFVDNSTKIANKYGAKFDDDIVDLVGFATDLDRTFGTQATTSLPGIMQDTARGASMAERAKETASSIGKRALTPDETKALKLLEQMVRNSAN